MLSICIPVYNFNITSLLIQLIEQAKKLDVPFEIICIDDASADEYRAANREAAENSTYIQLSKNIGRAAIRNLFLIYATYDYLLFLDCDSIIIDHQFLVHYIQDIRYSDNYDVICGGRIYNTKPPERQYRLRWLYGIKRESLPANQRNQNPNAAFMTNNFLIRADIFRQIRFDERLTGYGHEDTLFGFALQKKNISIHHINNPVLNGHLETNTEYLEKTKQAVTNLAGIIQYINGDKNFANSVSLLRFYNKVEGLSAIIRILFWLISPAIKWVLTNGYIYLPLFDFYKLGLLAKFINKTGK